MNSQELAPWMILIAAASPLLGALGAWVGVKIAVAKLQVRSDDHHERLELIDLSVKRLNDDSLIHDMEIESALGALKLPRARRQRARD